MLRSQLRDIRWLVVVLVTSSIAACMWLALSRLHVDSDLTKSIPAGNPVLQSGRRLLAKHPLIDWVAIDLTLSNGSADPERLVAAATLAEAELTASGQFATVGSGDWANGFAALNDSLVERLPTLFSREELETLVALRLSDASVRSRLEETYAKLSELAGVGQAKDMAADPLGLRELVYARLAALFPKTDAQIERNHLVSKDGKHLLLTAVPHHALGDADSSRRIAAALNRAQQRLDSWSARDRGAAVVLTPTGAYRAAMDNEAIVKRDTNRAVWLVTIAVSVLLLGCFSRPILGLLTLLPATAGVAIALLLYSCFSRSMSALSLGFGAALISITVDQGIVYIAYLDRVRGATGTKAAKQTFSAVSLATLTTVGAFFALKFSGYPLLEQLGIFAALGSAFSFAFVHTVFPLVFRSVTPTVRRPAIPIDSWLRWLADGSPWPRLALAAAIAVGLGAFARPRFEVDLNRLNTVSESTRAAEEQVRRIWGNLMDRTYLLLEAPSPEELQRQSDALSRFLNQERAFGSTEAAFSPSDLWPGEQLASEHLAAWRAFWDESRRSKLKASLASAGREFGFAPDAFEAFASAIEAPHPKTEPIPKEAYPLLGVARARDDSGWVWLGGIERGPRYEASAFTTRAANAGFSVFDGAYFGQNLNVFLGSAFKRMLAIVAPFVLLAVGLSFQNVRLVLLVLFPVVLAFVATLGAFGLMGRPIDIPGLMISVVVLGMGTNFSVYLVNAHQRYPDPNHRIHDSVRVAAMLDGGATVLGMGVIAASSHVAARSAGLSGVLGIGFSLLGALFLLPPVLRRFAPIGVPWSTPPGASVERRFLSRFRFLEPRVVRSARRLLREVGRDAPFVGELGDAQHWLVLGDPEATRSAWILANHPHCRVTLVEPDEDRSHVARAVLAERGRVVGENWPEPAQLDEPIDAVLVLDDASVAGPESSRNWIETFGRLLPLDAPILVSARISERSHLRSTLDQLGYASTAVRPGANLTVCRRVPQP